MGALVSAGLQGGAGRFVCTCARKIQLLSSKRDLVSENVAFSGPEQDV